MLIAIDHGNYAIKTPHHSFVSGLSEHTVKPPMSDEILEYDGRYWTTSGKRLSYMRDKTQDDRYFVLTLFAIAKELEDTGRYSPVEQIQLAVGLPPEHYGVLKDKFTRYFKRDGIIKFVYKDKPYSIMIDKVMVFPQAYAAVVPKSSMVVNMLRVFVVDIGGYQEAASRKRLPQFGHPLGDEYELSDEIPDPGDVENESLLKVMVSEALSRFDERDRIIIRYYLTGELTARQIEGRYDIPRNTVSNRARMLKKILQKIFLDLGQN